MGRIQGLKRLLLPIIKHKINYWRFKSIGKKTLIFSPLKINGSKNIIIGNNVIVEYKTWLAAVPLTGGEECVLEIGDGTVLGHFNHIYSTKSIIIGKNVLTADKVYISDNLHNYEDINMPIMNQGVIQKKGVVIGDGTWIGENVCIIGVKIGRNCVVGANSVVTKDVPDYSVVVGCPAKIIKRYNLYTNTWEKTDSKGNFIEI